MLPDLAREGSVGEHILRRQPDSNTLRRPGEVAHAELFQRRLDVLGFHLTRGQVVDALVNNPPTLFADPWLLLCKLENKIDDLGPLLKGHGGLEQDGGFDDRFSAEETAEKVVALFLYETKGYPS